MDRGKGHKNNSLSSWKKLILKSLLGTIYKYFMIVNVSKHFQQFMKLYSQVKNIE
jgi:hypothetical protein